MKEKAGYIFIRYLFVLLIGFPRLDLFYFIFTPLTIYPAYFILSLFYPILLTDNSFIINNISISIVDACIAGAAYYLLVILNFSLPLPVKKRIFSLIFSLSAFLLLNILRIVVFSALLLSSFQYFDITHKIFWYLLSGVLVFLIWLLTIKLFKIKDIPFYTDLSRIYQLTKSNKKKK